MKLKKPFDRELIFAEVDASNKRFEKYTSAERQKFKLDRNRNYFGRFWLWYIEQ